MFTYSEFTLVLWGGGLAGGSGEAGVSRTSAGFAGPLVIPIMSFINFAIVLLSGIVLYKYFFSSANLYKKNALSMEMTIHLGL